MIPTVLVVLLFLVLVLWGVDIVLTWVLMHLPPRPKQGKPNKEELDAFHEEVRRMNDDN